MKSVDEENDNATGAPSPGRFLKVHQYGASQPTIVVKLLQFAKLGRHSELVIKFRKDYTCRNSTWP